MNPHRLAAELEPEPEAPFPAGTHYPVRGPLPRCPACGVKLERTHESTNVLFGGPHGVLARCRVATAHVHCRCRYCGSEWTNLPHILPGDPAP